MYDSVKLKSYLQAGICRNRLSSLRLHINVDVDFDVEHAKYILARNTRYVHLQPFVNQVLEHIIFLR